MKLSRLGLVSAFSLLSATAALAAPKVGDMATLDGSLVGSGMNVKVTATQKITGFNVNTAVYTVAQSQTIAGQSQSKEVNVSADDIMSEETAALIVQACEAQGLGKNEKVTVPAGTFDTCRVPGNDGATYWVAPVPFGIVKLQSQIDAGTITLGLSAYARGQ